MSLNHSALARWWLVRRRELHGKRRGYAPLSFHVRFKTCLQRIHQTHKNCGFLQLQHLNSQPLGPSSVKRSLPGPPALRGWLALPFSTASWCLADGHCTFELSVVVALKKKNMFALIDGASLSLSIMTSWCDLVANPRFWWKRIFRDLDSAPHPPPTPRQPQRLLILATNSTMCFRLVICRAFCKVFQKRS